jgi:hypothetical protein
MLSTFGRHPWPMMGLALASGRVGQREIAAAVYDELAARARLDYVQPSVLAIAAIGAGRRADAFRHLREAAELRDPMFALLALFWPGLDPVRKEPEFAQILRGMGWDRPFDAAIEGPSLAAKTEGARPSVPGASRM